MSLAPYAEDESSAGGLQGLSPGPGQDTYAAKFRSPYPNSQQPSTVAEQSILSAFDATSPICGKTWGNGSFASPGAASIQTASSLCLNDEGEETDSKRIGAWGEEEEEEEVQMIGGKEDRVHEETTEDESDNMEVAEEEDDEKGVGRGETWGKMHEEARPDEKDPKRTRREEELSFPDGHRGAVFAAAASPAKNGVGDSPVSRQARGSATRYEGNVGESNKHTNEASLDFNVTGALSSDYISSLLRIARPGFIPKLRLTVKFYRPLDRIQHECRESYECTLGNCHCAYPRLGSQTHDGAKGPFGCRVLPKRPSYPPALLQPY